MSVLMFVMFIGVISKTSEAHTDSITCGTNRNNSEKIYEDPFCYKVRDMDDLEYYNERAWSEGSIYFIDATCRGGLNVREACSVEAAAKVNPTRQVNVFFAGPIQLMCLTSEPLLSVLTYHNVQFRRIYVQEFAESSGLDYLLTQSSITTGPHPNLYALELLKYITLHKFDGIYMDLDIIATRPFNELPLSGNWVVIEDHKKGTLSSAILAASLDAVGREFIESVISVLRDNATSWSLRDSHQSSRILKMALERRYGSIPFHNGTEGDSFKQPDSLHLYASKFFLPVPCQSSNVYFESPVAEGSLEGAFTQRVCAGPTARFAITEQSAYAQLMREFCPRVYEHFAKTGFKKFRYTLSQRVSTLTAKEKF